MKNLLARLIPTRNAAEADTVHATYIALMQQARNPFFYTDCAVPDTLDGRFDLLALHLALVLSRLQHEKNPPLRDFGQQLVETLVSDYDRTLREMGVSDTGVPRRMKAMVRAFYGRLAAYDAAWEDAGALQQALARNVYGTVPSAPTAGIEKLARYTGAAYRHLAGYTAEALMTGSIRWPSFPQ